MDSLKVREFKISNGGTQSDSDVGYSVELTSVVPFMNLSDTFVNETTLDTFSVSNQEPSNTPYDPVYDDRFIFVAVFKSIQRDMSMVLYYDKKYTDFITFPNPDLIDVNNVKNKVFKISSFRVGTNLPTNKYSNGYELSIHEINKINLPEPDTKPDPYDVVLLNISGLYNGFKQRIRKDLSTNVVMYKDVNMIAFMKIRKDDVFTDTDVKLPVSTLIPDSDIKFRVEYNGLKDPDYIYIPIMV